MDKKQLILELKKLQKSNDPESAHSRADDLLLLFIADEDIESNFNAIEKWYA